MFTYKSEQHTGYFYTDSYAGTRANKMLPRPWHLKNHHSNRRKNQTRENHGLVGKRLPPGSPCIPSSMYAPRRSRLRDGPGTLKTPRSLYEPSTAKIKPSYRIWADMFLKVHLAHYDGRGHCHYRDIGNRLYPALNSGSTSVVYMNVYFNLKRSQETIYYSRNHLVLPFSSPS